MERKGMSRRTLLTFLAGGSVVSMLSDRLEGWFDNGRTRNPNFTPEEVAKHGNTIPLTPGFSVGPDSKSVNYFPVDPKLFKKLGIQMMVHFDDPLATPFSTQLWELAFGKSAPNLGSTTSFMQCAVEVPTGERFRKVSGKTSKVIPLLVTSAHAMDDVEDDVVERKAITATFIGYHEDGSPSFSSDSVSWKVHSVGWSNSSATSNALDWAAFDPFAYGFNQDTRAAVDEFCTGVVSPRMRPAVIQQSLLTFRTRALMIHEKMSEKSARRQAKEDIEQLYAALLAGRQEGEELCIIAGFPVVGDVPTPDISFCYAKFNPTLNVYDVRTNVRGAANVSDATLTTGGLSGGPMISVETGEIRGICTSVNYRGYDSDMIVTPMPKRAILAEPTNLYDRYHGRI